MQIVHFVQIVKSHFSADVHNFAYEIENGIQIAHLLVEEANATRY